MAGVAVGATWHRLRVWLATARRAAALAVLWPGLAQAQGFAAPALLARGQPAGGSASAIDASGNAVVVWAGQARYRPAGGDWGPAVPLAGSGTPLLRMAESGAATIVAADGRDLWAQDMAPGGAWKPPQLVARDSAGPPRFVMDARGDAAIVFGLRALRRPAGAARWGAPETIAVPPPGLRARLGSVAMSGRGDLLVTWETFRVVCAPQCYRDRFVLRAAREAAGETAWRGAGRIAGPGLPHETLAVLDRQAQAAVAYSDFDLATRRSVIRASTQLVADGAWSAPATVFAGGVGDPLVMVGVAADGAGHASLALLDSGPAGGYVVVDGSITRDRWGPSTRLAGADPGGSDAFAFGADRRGGSAIAWSDADGATRVVSRPQFGATWSAVRTAGAAACADSFAYCATVGSVALNPLGQEVVTWSAQDGPTAPASIAAATAD